MRAKNGRGTFYLWLLEHAGEKARVSWAGTEVQAWPGRHLASGEESRQGSRLGGGGEM